MAGAACCHEDPELFFPVSMKGAGLEQVADAKAICAICSVHGRCLEYALALPAESGIWGGMDEDDRRTLRGRAIARRPST